MQVSDFTADKPGELVRNLGGDWCFVPGLLPGKEVAVGAAWTLPTPVVLALCDLDGLVRQLGRLDDFGYTAIPRHVQEALLIYQRLKGTPLDLHGRRIRPETVQRFAEFAEAFDRARKNPEDRPAVERNFGNTFWFYFYTGPRRSQ